MLVYHEHSRGHFSSCKLTLWHLLDLLPAPAQKSNAYANKVVGNSKAFTILTIGQFHFHCVYIFVPWSLSSQIGSVHIDLRTNTVFLLYTACGIFPGSFWFFANE